MTPVVSPEGITATIGMRYLAFDVGVSVDVGLSYRQDDPYAVKLTYRSGAVTVEHAMDRGFLIDVVDDKGLTVRGDVRAWVTCHRELVFALKSADGVTFLEAPLMEVRRFLALTKLRVRRGFESQFLDLDGLIEQLAAGPDRRTGPSPTGESLRNPTPEETS